MKRKILLSMVALLLAISLVAIGCAAPAPEPVPGPPGPPGPPGAPGAPAPAPVPPEEVQVVEFSFATVMKEGDPSIAAIQKWAETMKEKSGGTLQMTVYPGGVLGGDKELHELVAINSLQVHHAGPTILHHLIPKYQVLEAEYVYDDEAHGRRVWDGPIGEEINQELIERYDTRLIGVASRGARHVTANKPIYGLDDFVGLKIRVTNPLRMEVFKAFGALPVPISYPELYGAMKTGVVDAQENPIVAICASHFYEVQDYIMMTAHIWTYYCFTVNNSFFEALSPKHREVFMSTWKDVVRDELDREIPRRTEAALQTMVDAGMTVIEPDSESLKEVARPIVQDFALRECKPGLFDEIAKYASK